MAENQLVITITGDTKDLEKTLSDVSKKISGASSAIAQQGTIGGREFNSRLIGEFDKIKTLSTGSFSALSQSFITMALNPITLSVATLGATLYGAFSLAKVGEENNKIAQNFAIIAEQAGLNAGDLKERLSEVAEGYADLEDVLPLAGDAIIKLGDGAKRLGDLFELSRNISIRTGKDIGEVFQGLSNGVTATNEKMLRNNGIVLDTKTVLQEYAKGLNTTADRLTDTAKRQAVMNAVLEKGQQFFGDNTKEIAPMESASRKLALAFDDLKDAVAGIVNSKLGGFFADVIEGAAIATKAVANFFTPKVEDNSIKGQMAEIKAKMDEIKQSKLDNPAFAEGYNRQLNELNTKMLALQNVQLAINKANKEQKEQAPDRETSVIGETDEELRARLQRQADIKTEYQLLEAQTEAQIQASKFEAEQAQDATFAEKQQFQLENKRALLEAEYQATVEKNSKIKNDNERALANELALAKKDNEEKKFLANQSVVVQKTSADAKLKIEENLFQAGLNFAQGNAQATKAIQVAQAIRNTYEGATLALKTYPPPFNAIAAASTVALGLSTVAKITGANQGALVTGGEVGKDTNPFLLSKGEIVAPAKSYDNVVEGEIRARGFVKGDENQATNALLEQILGKLQTPSIVVNSDFLTDDNSINKLADKLREAVQFRGAELA
jgi:hypothetical protein